MSESLRVSEQIAALRQAIAAQEGLRETLGDAIVDTTITALNQQIAILESSTAKQRKLVTILFTDIVGSTEFTRNLDPEDIVTIQDTALHELASVIDNHDGRVTRFSGDGFKAVFGLPLAKENDAERAIRAGLAMLNVAASYAARIAADWDRKGFNIRVGINSGLVAAGGISESSDTIMGQAVNLAARLESAAPAGSILISRATYQHVRGVFDVVPQEPLFLKGVAEPVQTYLITGTKRQAFRIGRRGVEGIQTRMIGRELELSQLQDAYETAVEERKCQVVTVVGEAGVGKSRLLDEFQDWIDQRAGVIGIYKGRAFQNSQDMPLALLRNMIVCRFQILDDDDLATVREKLERGFRERNITQKIAQQHAQIVGQWLGFDFPDTLNMRVSGPAELQNRALLYLSEYFKELANKGPLVILLEDIHWADNSSLIAIRELSNRLREQQLLIAGVARPYLYERWPSWGEGHATQHRIDLHPLSKRYSRQLIAEVLQRVKNVPPVLQELIIAGAEGNPFFLEELIKMLVEDGVIIKDQPHWVVSMDRLAELKVPDTLTAVLQARLDRLPSMEKMIMRQAAVIGRTFWDEAVAYLATTAPDQETLLPGTFGSLAEVQGALDTLRGQEMIFHHETSTIIGAQEHRFKHDVLQQVTYESVLKNSRRIYHGLVAEWLIRRNKDRRREVTGLIARHLEQAGKNDQAIEVLQQAGEQAAGQYSNEEAVAYFTRALDLLPEGASNRRMELLLAREAVFHRTGQRKMQKKDLQSLDELITRFVAPEGDMNSWRLRITRRWMNYAGANRDFQNGIRMAKKMVKLAHDAGDIVQEAEGYYTWGSMMVFMRDFEGARKLLDKSLALAKNADARLLEGKITRSMGTLEYHHGQLDRSGDYYHWALAISREIGNRNLEAAIYNSLGNLAFTLGDFESALFFHNMDLDYSREIGDLQGQKYALTNLGMATNQSGDHEASEDYHKQALSLDSDMDNRWIEGLSFRAFGDIATHKGAYDEAHANYQQSLAIFREHEQPHNMILSLPGAARTALKLGYLKKVEAYISEILAFKEENPNFEGVHHPYQALWLSYRLMVEWEDPCAENLLRDAYQILQEWAATIKDRKARRLFLENDPVNRAIVGAWENSRTMQNPKSSQ